MGRVESDDEAGAGERAVKIEEWRVKLQEESEAIKEREKANMPEEWKMEEWSEEEKKQNENERPAIMEEWRAELRRQWEAMPEEWKKEQMMSMVEKSEAKID